jgi:hypothetical protein
MLYVVRQQDMGRRTPPEKTGLQDYIQNLKKGPGDQFSIVGRSGKTITIR